MFEPEFSLEMLYQAIEEHITQAIPGLACVCTMPHMAKHVDLPAAVLELAGFDPGLDQGTGETALIARLEVRFIVGSEDVDCLQKAAFAAAQMAVLLRMQSWGLPVEQAEFVQSAQDWTRPELDGYAVWVVEWTQGIYLGEEEWPWPNQPSGSLVWGFSPNTGSGSEGSYLPPEAMG
ncbi:hypothetical protein DM813_25935 [Pseudomonas alkylphenolica]|uniref:Phage protein n=1 Tax=Pseudomonas alkylphenolica TaxID=237609 RepID=A0A443ZGW4_9PSED|nr:hypothetical protein [Pseudomonas alkylphenolica]RWU18106.1 hypothetical protein DM813_25935 [Pseudomonas alkylphenolica]